VAALIAAPVALLAAVGSVYAVDALRDDGAGAVEADLRLTPGDAEAVVEGDPTGQAAPHGSWPLLGGGRASLADYKGRPVVLNFFASWCAPCEDEMPALERVAGGLDGRVAMVGLSLDTEIDDARAIAERTGVTYDLGLDEDGDVAAELGVVNLPTTVFISADHRVVDVEPGALSEQELRERAETLLEPA